jgi:hypothetical protein
VTPTFVAWFRGVVMAHIEFTANGVLMVAFGFLAGELNLSPAAWKVCLQLAGGTDLHKDS